MRPLYLASTADHRCAALLALVPALLVAFLAAGCSGRSSANSGGSADTSTLHLAQTAEPTTLDPAQVQDGPTIELLMHVFDGLVQWTPENKLAPALAEKWAVTNGGKTYVFHIREGVKFHNGRALTSRDLAYSITRSLDPKVHSPVAVVYLGDIVGARDYRDGKASSVKGVETPDDRTLRLTIDAPKAYFLAKLSYPSAYAVCREEVEKTGGQVTKQSMIGTGPFTLEEYREGDRVILAANPSYFEGAPKLARIERRVIIDQGTRRDKFEGGELDIADISMAMFRQVRNDSDLKEKVREFPRPSIFYLALSQKAFAPFKDKRVRQAFAHAVDKSQIISTVHEGVPQQAEGIVPPGVPGHNAAFKGLAFDPDRAKKLLSEAGYPDGKGFPPLRLSFRAGQEDIKNTAVAVAEDLRNNLGINVELDETEWTTFLKQRNDGTMPFYFLRWAADYLDPQNFLTTMLHSQTPENTLGYANPEFDRLCEQADLMQDPTQRFATYGKAEAIAVDDAPWVPIYFQKDIELWNPRLKGVEESAMGHLPHKRTHFAE
jgi:oligopeptide transport system substrate-binding protein